MSVPSASGEQHDGRAAGRGWLIAILVLAYLLRIGVAIEYQRQHPWAERPVIDEASYERWALEVASGDLVGDGVFFQEPLYPYALALVYAVADDVPVDGEGRVGAVATRRQRTAARHAQAFLGAVLVALTFGLTRRAFGRGPALVAALAAATYRPLLLLPALLLKPNLFLPVVAGLLLALLSAARARPGTRAALLRWLGVGALGGCAALLRGNALILLPLLCLAPVCFERSRRALAATAAIAVGVVALLLPVALRNQAVGGVFALSTSGAGTNVYGGNAPENPYGYAREFPWVRGIPEHEAEDWRREAERRSGRSLDPGGVSRYWLRELGASLVREPGGHALRLWRKLRLSLGAYEVPDNHDIAWDARYLASLRLPLPGWELWGTLGLAGLFTFLLTRARSGASGTAAANVLAFAFCAYLATIVLTVTSGRIRLMLVPLLLPFAGWMLCLLVASAGTLAQRIGRHERVSVKVILPVSLLAILLVFVPALPAELRAQKLDGRDMNHVRILLERAEDLDQAAELSHELAAEYQGDPRVATLAAEVSFRRAGVLLAQVPSDRAGAGAELTAAMQRLRPVAENPAVAPKERFRAQLLAGLCQLRAGSKPGAARRHFEAALAWDPSDRVGRLGLANALALEADEAEPTRAHELRSQALKLVQGLRSERDEPPLAERERELDERMESTAR